MTAEAIKTLVISEGGLRIHVTGPVSSSEEPRGRISFWWGLTAASVALARHLQRDTNLKGTRVIELGCGLGLAGITAGLQGAHVTFTDYVPRALHYASENARANGLDEKYCEFRLLDWEDAVDVHSYQLILGAEIAYDYFLHDSLLRLCKRLLEPGGRILMADRKRLVIRRFLGRLVNDGYRCTETLQLVSPSGVPEQEISIFELEENG